MLRLPFLVVCASAFAGAVGPHDPGVYSLLKYPKLCGVIGGVGPEATANFLLDGIVRGQGRLFAALQKSALSGASFQGQTAAVLNTSFADWSQPDVTRLSLFPNDIKVTHLDDQHHIPLQIYDNPQIPDRTEYILDHSLNASGPLDPRPLLIKSAQDLVAGGSTCVCVTCNTAHFFLPDIIAGEYSLLVCASRCAPF